MTVADSGPVASPSEGQRASAWCSFCKANTEHWIDGTLWGCQECGSVTRKQTGQAEPSFSEGCTKGALRHERDELDDRLQAEADHAAELHDIARSEESE